MTPSDIKARLFAIRLSLIVGVVMLAGKWYAFAITGSAAVLSDAAESVVHILAVAFAAFSMWLSLRPADSSHPYGHDKISFFSAGVEGGLIVVAACYIIYKAVMRLVHGVELENMGEGAVVILCASVVNLILGRYLIARGRKISSIILVANGKHVLTDSWTSFGVVAGLLLVRWTGWFPLDPLLAIAIAGNVIWSGGTLVRQSVGGLMDEGDPALGERIRAVLDRETASRDLRYHELRYRTSGNTVWVEFHLLFKPGTYLVRAHAASTEIEKALAAALPMPAKIVTHLEPTAKHDEAHAEPLQH